MPLPRPSRSSWAIFSSDHLIFDAIQSPLCGGAASNGELWLDVRDAVHLSEEQLCERSGIEDAS